jgi:hypothetical protein
MTATEHVIRWSTAGAVVGVARSLLHADREGPAGLNVPREPG